MFPSTMAGVPSGGDRQDLPEQIFGGIRVPGGDIWTFGGELRYQKAEADLDPNVGFLGTKIDLGGWTTSFNFSLRF